MIQCSAWKIAGADTNQRKRLLHTSLPCSSPSCLLLLLRLGVPPVTCSAVPFQVGGCTLVVRWGGVYCRHFKLPSLIHIHSFWKSVHTCYCASARIERIRTVLYVAQQSWIVDSKSESFVKYLPFACCVELEEALCTCTPHQSHRWRVLGVGADPTASLMSVCNIVQ